MITTESYISKELKKYNMPDSAISELKDKYINVVVKNVDDNGNYEFCKTAHQEVKSLRVSIETKRMELKRSSIDFGNAVDAEAKRLTKEIRLVEDHLHSQRKIVEDEKERIKKEKEEAIRLEQERKQLP